MEGSSYIFKSGDEISIKFREGKPQIDILNRPTKPHDYNFESLAQYYLKNEKITPFEYFFRYLPFPNKQVSKDEYPEFLNNHLEKASPLLVESLVNKQKILDSLYQNEMLSTDIYNYYNKKLNYINWSRLTKLKKLPIPDQEIRVNSNIEEFTMNKLLINNKLPYELINIQKIIKAGDSLIHYKYYQDFLSDFYMPHYFEYQTSKYTYFYGNFGGNYRRWDDVYDTIQNSNLFTSNVKSFLLYKYMNKIAEDLSPTVVNEYYKKFSKISKTEDYIALLNYKYNLDSNVTSNLVLKDRFNKIHYLENILQQNEDKTILINFWASWCAPCIRLIPEWNKLQKNYSSERLLLISIAHEKDFNNWKNSEPLRSFKNSTNNYLLRNPYSSNFVKRNHINFVPRYILYHRGKIVNANAPTPGSEDLNIMLKKYLLE